MELRAARKYIAELHRKQDDPLCWPDYLTGLPGKSAIVKNLEKVYPRLGGYEMAYVRIANVYPYLIKYGYGRHVEIIEWATAILKTAADTGKDSFLGTFTTHDYILTAKARELDSILEKATLAFRKKIASFYSPSDRKSGVILSYKMGSRDVSVGLMDLIHTGLKTAPPVPQADLIAWLSRECSEAEKRMC